MKNIGNIIGFGVTALASLSLAFFSGLMLGHHDTIERTYCPTEDSCSVQYVDGQWVIREDTP